MFIVKRNTIKIFEKNYLDFEMVTTKKKLKKVLEDEDSSDNIRTNWWNDPWNTGWSSERR